MHEIFDKYGTDPIILLNQWLSEAEKSEPNDPEAVNLATCNLNGQPSNRMVLIKDISEKGLKFHTNSNSQKGEDLQKNDKASMCFYWKSLRKQVRIEGHIEMISAAEADDYFASRRRERQIGAWASNQSASFQNWDDLENAIKATEDKFKDVDNIPRPPYWNGYRLAPQKIEFWIAHHDRLHTRFVYTKTKGGKWDAAWLYP